MINPNKRKKRKYPPVTEAAWYVVKEFINPLLCSYDYGYGAIPFNTNELLNHHFSKTRVFNPYRYSKAKYHLHLFRFEDHFYRSHHNAKHFTGYHRSDKIAQDSVLNEILNVKTRKQEYPGYYIILCKIDIDGHNGEDDVEEVAKWLNNTYFDQSYWEPSTHNKGRHGYLKIAIPEDTPLEEVHDILNRLFKLIDIKRDLAGYQAPVDVPCGLPSIVTWDNSIKTPTNLPKITHKEYRDFRDLRNHMKELKKDNKTDELKQLNLQISDTLHYDDILKIVKTPVPAKIKSSQCGKLPRFNRTDGYSPSLDDILFFYALEYYEFSFFVDLLNNLETDPAILSYDPVISGLSSSSPVIPGLSPVIYKYDNLNISSNSSPSPGSTITPSELNIGHSVSKADSVINIGDKSNLPINTTSTITPSNHCLGKLAFKRNNKGFKSKIDKKNEEKEDISNDANNRTAIYITRYLRKYYRDNYTLPTVEQVQDEVCDGYRIKYGTGKEDKYDRKRIISLLDKCIKSFKVTGPRYTKEMFIPHIKLTFNKNEYKEILKNTAAKRSRPKNIILDLFAGYCYTHLSVNKELTLSTYDGFKKFCKKHGVIINDDNRCLACRLLFEHYGWLEKLDASYEIPEYENGEKKNGKSMAYALTEKFPYYAEFEKAVGRNNIDKVRAKGLASLQDWDSMGNSA